MNDILLDIIREKFADCMSEKEVCQLYAEIRLEADRQMEYMLEALKEQAEETDLTMKILPDVQKKIEERPKVSEWIPVQDASPEDGQLVLVTMNGEVYPVEFNGDWDAPYGDMDDVTAWMPLPESYKGD